MNDVVKMNFTPCYVLFRSSLKFRSDIIRAKSCPLVKTIGRECYKNRCELWFLRITHFPELLQVRVLKLIVSLNCENKCLVYLTTCEIRNKQCTGQTTGSFRFFAYILASDQVDCFLEHVQITFIERINCSDPTTKETFRMHSLKMLTPYGLNIENGIKKIFLHVTQFHQVWYLLV